MARKTVRLPRSILAVHRLVAPDSHYRFSIDRVTVEEGADNAKLTASDGHVGIEVVEPWPDSRSENLPMPDVAAALDSKTAPVFSIRLSAARAAQFFSAIAEAMGGGNDESACTVDFEGPEKPIRVRCERDGKVAVRAALMPMMKE